MVIRSFDDLKSLQIDPSEPIITLFSGGLDSTYLVARLAQDGFTNLHALNIDIGDGEAAEHLTAITSRLGVELHVVDARRRFAREFVASAITAQAMYLGMYPISASLSRPLLAEEAWKVAKTLGARVIIHTANRSQNTLRRINGALNLLGFDGYYGSPYDCEPIGRDRKIDELRAMHLTGFDRRSASVDANLWCREFESGILDDPEAHDVPEEFYRWSSKCGAPSSESMRLDFERGVPCAVDGVPVPIEELVPELNIRVGLHGLGRYSGLEHLVDGRKVLEIREAPAAWILMRSYRYLESAVLDAECIREKLHVEQLWVREAIEGRWFGDLRRASHEFVGQIAAKVTGSVTWRLDRGSTETISIMADDPIYLRDRETWESALAARLF